MPKVSALQCNFNGGEFSPLLLGRVDSDRYRTGLSTCLNFIPTIQGPLIRRSGSKFVNEVKTSSKKVRLVSFEFSTTQAYIIEFGDLYCRFYKDNGIITSGGPAYEIVTPFLEADLFQLKFTQSADILYITHPSYQPRKLSRTSHTSWTLTTVTFVDGPYLTANSTTTTLSANATAVGSTATITASAALFASTDVGRLIRMKVGSSWGNATITLFTSSTSVNALINVALDATTATTNWRLGVYSNTTGWPGVVCFHEDRLFFAGATNYPQRLDGSNSSDYENFTPTNVDGTVTDSRALAFSLNANDVNVIRWMTSDEKGLLAGTVGGEWVVKASTLNEAMTPTNISAKRATSYGSQNVQPIQSGKATLFVQRAGRKVREMTYFYDVDGFRANDITQIAEHVTGNAITQVAFQKVPQSLVWCVRDDGVLACVTYERDLDSVKVGWSRHILGGYSDSVNTSAKVESVAVIPSSDGTTQDVWLLVQRYINGSVKRYVEYFSRFFDEFVEQKDAFFVDCGLTYDNPLTISGITKANPAVVTATAHGFSNGDRVLISSVGGMTDVNGNTYTVAGVTTNTFQLSGINSTAFNTYVSGGVVRKLVTNISGLSHLEGQTVTILGDGAVQPNQVVSSGAITLASAAATVAIGYNYNSDGQMLRLEAGAADGTALGKTRRTHRVGFLLNRSLGLKIGTSLDELETITFRTSSDPLTRAPELFTGIISENLTCDYDFENQVCWRQDQPLPLTILAVMPQMVTQDRG